MPSFNVAPDRQGNWMQRYWKQVPFLSKALTNCFMMPSLLALASLSSSSVHHVLGYPITQKAWEFSVFPLYGHLGRGTSRRQVALTRGVVQTNAYPTCPIVGISAIPISRFRTGSPSLSGRRFPYCAAARGGTDRMPCCAHFVDFPAAGRCSV
ncbi:hypothetical protein T08_15001 [Trichinella sp. T8]|nr:hypothetical protein T08_15001 [Trichinella sp. T8]